MERFHNKYTIVSESGCWIWTAGLKVNNKYEQRPGFQIGKFFVAAHRVSWELHNGPIPEGMHVLHRCDVSLCVNPDHLYLGTHQDNMCDKKTRGRARNGNHGLRGCESHGGRLTTAQIRGMIVMRAEGATLREVADRYQCSVAWVSLVARGLRRVDA